MTVAIRGATNIYINEERPILEASKELLESIIKENHLDVNKIISIIFTATRDIDQAYPARAAREIGITKAGLICLNEMEVAGSMKNCLRVLIFYNDDLKMDDIKHIYLKNTKKLRPDLAHRR